MRRIDVPFEKKKFARKFGAVFVTNEPGRGWYIPDDCSEENAAILENIASYSEKEDEEDVQEDTKKAQNEDTSGLTWTREQYYGEGFSTNSTEISKDIPHDTDEKEDTNVPFSYETATTMEAVVHLTKFGLPRTEEERTKMLKKLGSTAPGQYPLEYTKLCSTCEEFARYYPPELVMNLVNRHIEMKKSYVEEIQHSSMTEEEKALLLFVLPLEE